MNLQFCKQDYERKEQNFLHNIAWLHKHHGLSKKRMAEVLGIGVGSLNKIENGEMPPRLGAGVFLRIYAYFGIRPKDLTEQRLDE